MTRPFAAASVRARILIEVIACAVVPLAAVGVWLTSTAARSGELLLRSQLDTVAARSATAVRESWSQRESDALLLADNEPVRDVLRNRATPGGMAFLRRAFETMPRIAAVVVRDTAGGVRWSLGEPPASRPAAQSGASSSSTLLPLRVPIHDGTSARPLGDVVAYVRPDALIPTLAAGDTNASDFVAVRDRASNAWFAPQAMPPSLLESDKFAWGGRRWLVARRSLTAPALDIVAVGAADRFIEPFRRTATAGATALAAVAAAVVVLAIYVTGRLAASLERSQRQAVSAMGELAATLAHQLRSPATAIRLDVQRAHDKLPADAPSRALLARALQQLDRLERAVAGSLKVSRSAGTEFRELELREPIERAIRGTGRVELASSARGKIMVQGDASSLEQLFANVVSNGVQASAAGGRVTITCEPASGGRVRATVRDDGEGMSPEILARAGEPLFSTKPEGTGLGLAIAKRIATAHGGTLTIESTPGVGTSVTIELPGRIESIGRPESTF